MISKKWKLLDFVLQSMMTNFGWSWTEQNPRKINNKPLDVTADIKHGSYVGHPLK